MLQDETIDKGLSATSAWAAVAASWLAASLLFLYWVHPLKPDQYGQPVGLLAWLMCIISGGFLYALIGNQLVNTTHRRRGTIAVWCLVLPVAFVVWGATLYTRHGYWREGVQAFNAYTGRFPRDALGQAYVLDEVSSVTTVCARQIKTQDTNFCVQTVTDPKYHVPGEWDVIGSFRFRHADQSGDAPAGLVLDRFDCTGELRDECP